jgi:hypothetical protein
MGIFKDDDMGMISFLHTCHFNTVPSLGVVCLLFSISFLCVLTVSRIGFTGGLHNIHGLVYGCLCFLVLPSAAHILIFFCPLHLFLVIHVPSSMSLICSDFASTSMTSSCHVMTTVLGRVVFLMMHWFLASSGGSSISVRLG